MLRPPRLALRLVRFSVLLLGSNIAASLRELRLQMAASTLSIERAVSTRRKRQCCWMQSTRRYGRNCLGTRIRKRRGQTAGGADLGVRISICWICYLMTMLEV
ncbi:unnamed protein product [Amoebophrya sp. A120]|nr:unnamed protein product [Amoebophrya sp. A120]|eukprot:GSA120T00015563001.1